MEVWIAAIIMIIFSIWWYTDLYKIITNITDKLLVKNKLINMCISTIVNIILLVFIIAVVVD